MVNGTRNASLPPGLRASRASRVSRVSRVSRGAIALLFVGKRFKGAADLIALRILEKRLRNQIVLAALPRRDWSEDPGGVVGLQADFAVNRTPGCGFYTERSHENAMVEWPRESDDETISRTGRRARHRPIRERNRFVQDRTDTERVTVSAFERKPIGVGPRRRDVERVPAPRAKRTPALPVREDVVLHAARIEKQRVARVVRTPEVGLDGQKGARLDALGPADLSPGPDSSTSFTKSSPAPLPIGAENSM